VPLSYRRDGERFDVFVRLAGVHTRAELQKMLERQETPEELPPRDRQPDPNPDPDRKNPPDQKPPVEIPPEVAKMIVPRAGFKNYYFNELNRERVWRQFIAGGDFSGSTMPWEAKGQLASGGDFTMSLGESESKLELPGATAQVTEGQDLSEQLEPGGTGLLAALHVWRRMLVLGPQKFGDVRYLGKSPVPGREGLFDVLVATHNVAEAYFYFDPTSGRLIALEMFPDSGSDPCELLFDDYRPVNGKSFPHAIVVRRGGQVISEWRVASVKL
jgi:hypothetical protein